MNTKSKSIKIILGVATLWPAAYFFIFMVSFVTTFMEPGSGKDSFFILMIVHMLTMLWMIGLMIIYIVDVFRNPRIANDMKVLWAVILFFGNMFAMPVYWYLQIWRTPAASVQGTVSKYFTGQNIGAGPQPQAGVIYCPKCGGRNKSENKFCMSCGQSLDTNF